MFSHKSIINYNQNCIDKIDGQTLVNMVATSQYKTLNFTFEKTKTFSKKTPWNHDSIMLINTTQPWFCCTIEVKIKFQNESIPKLHICGENQIAHQNHESIVLFGSEKNCTTKLCFRCAIWGWKKITMKVCFRCGEKIIIKVLLLLWKRTFVVVFFTSKLHNRNTIPLCNFSRTSFGIWIKYTHTGNAISKSGSANSNTHYSDCWFMHLQIVSCTLFRLFFLPFRLVKSQNL